MHTDGFETAFGAFLERREYDEAEGALFAMVRTAFAAGWRAAGGQVPLPQPVFQLLPPFSDMQEKPLE